MSVQTAMTKALATGLLLGAVASACAAPQTSQDPAALTVLTTTAAANAPHPLTTVPGVRIGVQIPAPTAVPSTPQATATVAGTATATATATGTLLPAKPRPTPVKVTSVDGCNRDYGTAAQCVPLFAPGHKPVTCAYLQSSGLFAKPLVVVRDPLGLLRKKNLRKAMTADRKYATISACTD